MKVLVISDSHGQADRLERILERVAADHVIHCGDFCTEQSRLPKHAFTVVRGNCDYEPVAEEEIWEVAGFRFYITHGHRYDVKSSPLAIRYRAEEVGAQVVCFGHSHFPYCEQAAGILLINPGSITQPRGFPVPTYACLEVEQQQINVKYYQVNGQPVKRLGGHFSFELPA